MRETGIREAWHAALFYEDAERLSRCVSDYVGSSISAGGQAVVVCTPHHWSLVRAQLRTSGHDVEDALVQGRLKLLDARSTLSRFLCGRELDRERFREAIEPAVRSFRTSRRVLVYGEMVDLLCQDGNAQAALELEQLWNELHKTVPFWLLCGYLYPPLRGRSTELKRVCGAHTHVIRMC